MVQIDDAGSGSLIGGTCIGLYFDKGRIIDFDFIPLEFFNPENFKKKLYQQQVINIVSNFFLKYSIPTDEPIEVCQGYIFDALRNYFAQNDFIWKNVKIQGVLQDKVEKTFADYAVSLGLPENYVLFTKYPFHFHKLLRWVYADYDARKSLCKTGWKSWKKYGDLPVEADFGIMDVPGYYCLKCGKKIRTKSPIRILKFFSNRQNIIYLHEDCASKTCQTS
ncbi:MAG: hypothetical protein NUV45_03385 [Tepidanaerobacteraceae bacterium]|nr:hypothetical protein [Tepidanaerobacteraceae bacterium]